MDCDSEIHNDLINMEEFTCPFCCQLLVKIKSTPTQCCSDHDIQSINGIMVCIQCGSVEASKIVSEFTDYYANLYRIRRKSIYQRKYHVESVLTDICYENKMNLSYDQRRKIYKAFVEISCIIPLINGSRKRMISTRYIIKQLFMMMGLKYDFIPITRSKKTRAFYDKYWDDILQLKNAEILHIIRE